jgi:predicted MFS family arabinose efflux permease
VKVLRWRAARLALGTTVGLGFGRFAYGLVLPSMAAQLHWTLAEAGLLTTANGLGYLLGAAGTASLARRYGVTSIFRLGMVVCCLALGMMGFSTDYEVLLAARALAGLGGAFVFIAGAVICRSPVFFAGTGMGIVVSGVCVPAVVAQHPERWPLVWLGFATLSTAATLLAWSAAAEDRSARVASRMQWQLRQLGIIGVAYFLFAVGYIAYITFLGVLLQERGEILTTSILVWSLLGTAVLVSPVLLRPLERWAPESRLTAVLVGLSFSAGLLLLSQQTVVLLVSVVGYGITFMAVPAAVAAVVHDAVSPGAVAGAMGGLTVVFAAGQGLGPWLAGLLADQTSSLATVTFTCVLCAVAAAVAAVGAQRVTRTGNASAGARTGGAPEIPR